MLVKKVKTILEKVINTHGATKTAEVLMILNQWDINILQSSYDSFHF
jgi:hypothetical protein